MLVCRAASKASLEILACLPATSKDKKISVVDLVTALQSRGCPVRASVVSHWLKAHWGFFMSPAFAKAHGYLCFSSTGDDSVLPVAVPDDCRCWYLGPRPVQSLPKKKVSITTPQQARDWLAGRGINCQRSRDRRLSPPPLPRLRSFAVTDDHFAAPATPVGPEPPVGGSPVLI